ncbi:MAG TPA: thioredoxin domain-containing protein [Kofleriaceae bacterium]|nr:thioredoxin domain-containing protein [Kofleriaceae bacterium]
MKALLLGAAALLTMLVSAAGTARAQARGYDPEAVYSVPIADSQRRGPDDALLTIVEFSDFSCRFCIRSQIVLEQVERLYPGQVRWVFRHFPLDEAEGTLAAEAAVAASNQGKFWPMHDRLFAVRGNVDRAAVELYASELGLDLVRFRADLDSGDAKKVVLRDWKDGVRLGISGTPAFFVNGRALHGARPLSAFNRVIAQELGRAREALAKKPGDLYAALVAEGRTTADVEDPEPEVIELDPSTIYRIGLGLPGHAAGPSDALVTVVVFSDFECPYCARMVPTLARLRKERPDVRIVYRHMPLSGHPGADLAAEAAVVAGRAGKFWAFHDQVFKQIGTPLTRGVLLDAGKAAGLDRAELAAALDDHRYRDLVLSEGGSANALGATGTPTLFINGMPIPGAVPYEQLTLVIDAQLVAARDLVARGVPQQDVYGVIGIAASAAETGDPRRLPRPNSFGHIEMGPLERDAAIVSACRAGDDDEAKALAGSSGGGARAREVCGDFGVDLPAAAPPKPRKKTAP